MSNTGVAGEPFSDRPRCADPVIATFLRAFNDRLGHDAGDRLLIEAKIRPADVAFLHAGQSATVKLTAYDYTIYGSLHGHLEHISADTLSEDLRQGEQPYYRVQVQTIGRQFSGKPHEQLEIQPGMTATIEIRTGERTVLQYLTKPVTKTLTQSLGER